MSVLWSVNPKVTFLKTGSLAFFSIAAFGVSRQLTLRDLVIAFTSICVIYIFVSLAVEIVSGNFKPAKTDYRFVGSCHPNILGSYAAVCCLGAGIYSSGKGRISLLTILVFAIGVVTLYLTKSRTSMFGLLFGVLAIYAVTLKPGTRILAISFLSMLFVAAAGFLAVSGGKIWSSAGGLMVMGRTENTKTLTGRIPLWEELLESVAERPVLGHGYLAFWDKDGVERLSQLFGWEIPHGHNMYIDVLLDGGAVGLTLFAGILLVGLAVSLLRYLDHHRAFGIAFAFALITYVMVHGMGESLFKLHTFLSFMLVTCLLRVGSLKPGAEQ